ncbi:glutamine-tRNA ligase [Pseudohyphozyma bogoriensis]|nr:glutamine-tRNA ligase [Pseudohyphozyma bogoriensis]
MAPKLTEEMKALAEYFEKCGLSPVRSLETVKNPKTSAPAHALFVDNKLDARGLNDKQGMLVLSIAKDGAKLSAEEKAYLVDAVADGRLKAADQVSAGVKYLTANPAPVDTAAFDKACGVGFSATPEEILALVRSYVEEHKAELSWAAFGKTTGQFKTHEGLRWANALEVKNATEKVFEEVLGPKTAPAKAPPKAPAKPKEEAAGSADVPPEEMFATGWISKLHKPGGNPQPIPERMTEHLAATGGKVFTRFPPEPNGFLHIGHSKAIAVNFGYAKYHKGHCYLRFDDTNPEAEEQIYFDKILEAVRWLGYEPYKITHSSDNFQKLYDLAIMLIKKGLAYTSDDTAEEIAAQRGGKDHGPRHESKDRNKPVEQSLAEFADMKAGKYKPGQMTLRMKQDMLSGNPVMWDIIAYRVLETPHHRTGRDWCIYPTYDFTHCLCDSFENISHSLCTTEFIGAREAYEWLCDALEVYKPRQSEYGRLSLEGTITSKRKLLKLVKDGHVSGWDDPRLYTLVALKRRGVPPGAIINFVSNLGISTSASHVQLPRFEQTVRQHLETTTPRLMMVLNPVRVTIENLPSTFVEFVEKPIHPKNPSMGSNKVPFTSTIFIDTDDFKTTASPDFFRLSPGATVGLLNVPHPITYVSHEVDAKGDVTSIVCRYDDSPSAPKPKAWIQWVAEHAESNSPVKVEETRIFKRLFKSDDPASLGDAYIQDIDKDSLKRILGALLEVGIWKVIEDSLAAVKKTAEERRKEAEKAGTEAPPQVEGVEAVRFQGLRVAYFALDYDSKLTSGAVAGAKREDKLVLNMIAPLKAAKGA